MNYILQLKYNKLIRDGKTHDEALRVVEEIDMRRKEKVKASQTSESLALFFKSGQKANSGMKRSQESKDKMRQSNLDYRRKNLDKLNASNEKRKATFAAKTEEEKLETNLRRGVAIRKWWAENKDSDKIKKRNEACSIRNKGIIRTEESKLKQSQANMGKKASRETKLKMAKTRVRKAVNGENMGLKSKFYKVGDYMCQGKWEKVYIENLYRDGLPLPDSRGSFIETPKGVYHPDFEFKDKFIEVKSTYTHEIFLGERVNIDGVHLTNQLEKALWVSKNVKSVEVLILDSKGIVVNSYILS